MFEIDYNRIDKLYVDARSYHFEIYESLIHRMHLLSVCSISMSREKHLCTHYLVESDTVTDL